MINIALCCNDFGNVYCVTLVLSTSWSVFTYLSKPLNIFAYCDCLEFLPGKRALAIGLTVFHCIASTILFQAPRFVPFSLGALAESCVFMIRTLNPEETHEYNRFKITPEILWGGAHGFMSLGFVFWWQATVSQAAVMRKTK